MGFLALIGDLAKERREREEGKKRPIRGRLTLKPFNSSKPRSESRDSGLPAVRPAQVPDEGFREEHGERRTAVLPGSPPEEISSGRPPREGEEITERTKERLDSMTPEEKRAEEPLSGVEFREESIVIARMEELKLRTPERFHEYIDKAMEILTSNYKGTDSLIDKMVAERRWKWGREERIIQSAGLAMGDMSHVFEKMVKDEAIRRYKNRKEYSKKGVVTPEEVERDFLFTVISSHTETESKEMCLFDAWAKCVSFMVLGKRRSKDLFYALDHPEISRPYEKLGGMEALGVYVGLELPDLDKLERTAKQVGRPPDSLSSSHIGPVFQLAVEAHLTHLIQWIHKAVLLWPGDDRVVEGFERFVRDELKDFQTSVSEAGFTAEMFFQLLQRERHDGLREETPLQEIFENAATGPGRLVYGYQDDVFDALESILDYMYLLRENNEAKKLFINHFLANYPLESNGGTFYKIFGMSLFTDREDMENHPHTIAAFRTDDDHLIKYHVDEVLRRLEGRSSRSTLVDVGQDEIDAAFDGMDGSDSF